MKVKSASLLLFHYLDGEHREVARWHNDVHRPEIHGAVPNIYYSQDWVAPADYVSARPPTELNTQGGEYVSLYWSQGTREELVRDHLPLAQARQKQGGYHPHQTVIWRGRPDIHCAYPRPDLEYELDGVPLAPNTGLMVSIEEITDPSRERDYMQWQRTVRIPRLLESKLFSACFEFRLDRAFTQKDVVYAGHPKTPLTPAQSGFATEGQEGLNVYLRLYFVEREDPLAAFTTVQELDEQLTRERSAAARLEEVAQHTFTGMYLPITSGDYDYGRP